jgi:hypothetical protein
VSVQIWRRRGGGGADESPRGWSNGSICACRLGTGNEETDAYVSTVHVREFDNKFSII